MRLIYLPNMPNVNMPSKIVRQGRGMGSVLLSTGGPGSGSSYESEPEYEATTGRTLGGMTMPSSRGNGLGYGLQKKLESLSIAKPKSRKSKNITFNL